jgi:protein farnesyltransferase/geranylgeranyltransferase type-1 subunit alpha
LGGDNPKNYQIWYHRRALLEKHAAHAQQQQQQQQNISLRDIGTAELDYIATVLQADGKNYHAWSHRQWVVNKIMATNNSDNDEDDDNVWRSEMEYAAQLLDTDVRNNSAWNHRWFALHRHGASLSLEVARDELEFCLTQAQMDLDNESPFRFLVALLLELFKKPTLNDASKNEMASLLDEYLGKVSTLEQQEEAAGGGQGGGGHDDDPTSTMSTSRHVTGTLVDLLEFKGNAASLTQALILVDVLAIRQDPIREKYWNLRRLQIQQKQQQQQQP